MNKIYTRLPACAVFGMSLALLWDAWWHVAVGRDQFWIPPHILLYICLTLLLVTAFFGWRKTKLPALRNIFFLSFLFPITGVLDQLWHSVFGVENLVSPIVVWSPPHLLILASLVTVTLYTRKIVALDTDANLKWLMRCTVFAAFLGFAFLFMIPFYPLGAYHVWGFWGAGAIMFVWIAITLYEQRKFKQTGTVLLVTALFMLLTSMSPALIVKPAEEIIIGAIHNPPMWLFIFSFIVPALFIEIAHAWHPILKGIVAGCLAGIIFYFPARYFIDVPSLYGMHDTWIAVLSCSFGGLFAGILSQITFEEKKQ